MYNTHLITDNPIAAHLGTEEELFLVHTTYIVGASLAGLSSKDFSCGVSESWCFCLQYMRNCFATQASVFMRAAQSVPGCFGAAQNAMRWMVRYTRHDRKQRHDYRFAASSQPDSSSAARRETEAVHAVAG
jgi:hypothetical protein